MGLFIALYLGLGNYAPVRADPPVWQVQSNYFGVVKVPSQPRNMAGLTLTRDGESLYLGLIDGKYTSIRRVDSELHALLEPTPDAAIIGNFASMTSTDDVHASNPAYTGGITSALLTTITLENYKKPRNIATDNRGYVYVSNGSVADRVTIYQPELAAIAGFFASYTTTGTGRGIDVVQTNAGYFAYLSTRDGVVQRWNVTNVAAPALDTTWGTTTAGQGAGGTLNLATVQGWTGIQLIDLVVGSDGTLYLTGSLGASQRLFKISGIGNLQSATSAEVANINYLTSAGDKLYATTHYGTSSRVLMIDKSTLGVLQILETEIPRSDSEGYTGIDIGPDGRLYVADQSYQVLTAYEPPKTTFNLTPTLMTDDSFLFDRVLVSSPVATPTLIISNVAGTGSGVIQVDPLQDFYFAGDSVTFTALPALGTLFTGWSGSTNSAASSIAITLGEVVHLTATFDLAHYTVNTNVVGSGSVSLNPARPSYTYGEQVMASAVPNTGWSFSGWSGDTNTSGPTASVLIDKSKAITAHFTLNHYVIGVTIAPEIGGTVSGAGSYGHGDNVTLQATPASGFAFARWTEAGATVSAQQAYQFTATGPRTLEAIFEPSPKATVTLQTVIEGSSVYAPTEGWAFSLAGATYTLPASGGSQLVSGLAPGIYTVTGPIDADYSVTVTCGGQTLSSNTIQINLDYGQALTCIFTYTLRSATLTVNTVVVNDHGGTAAAADFALFVNGTPVTNGAPVTLQPGTYTVSETNLDNYQARFSGDCSDSGVVMLDPGQSASCTITNDDVPPIDPIEKSAAARLVTTVGLADGQCAARRFLAVVPGETVYYCYTVTNTGSVTLIDHSLVDSHLGTLLKDQHTQLAVGQSLTTLALGIKPSLAITQETISAATWTAQAAGENTTIQASASSTVTLGYQNLSIAVETTDAPPTVSAVAGRLITYTFYVTNTGSAFLPNLYLHLLIPVGAKHTAPAAPWECVDSGTAGSTCADALGLLEPGAARSLTLTLALDAGFDTNQLQMVFTASTPGTSLTPPLIRRVILAGPDGVERTLLYLPGLVRSKPE